MEFCEDCRVELRILSACMFISAHHFPSFLVGPWMSCNDQFYQFVSAPLKRGCLGCAGTQALLSNDPNATERKIKWLKKELCLENRQIRQLLTRLPKVLEFELAYEMGPVFDRLEAMGIPRRQYQIMVVNCPPVLGVNVVDKIPLICDLLKVYGINMEQTIELIQAKAQVLKFDLENMRLMLDWMLSMNVPRESLLRVLRKCPELFSVNSINKIELKIRWLEENLEIERDDVVMRALVKAPAIFEKVTINVFKERIDYFRSEGFSSNDCRKMILSLPGILDKRPGALIPRVKFAKEVLQKTPAQVAKVPNFFTVSLSERILFRAACLDSKGEDYKAKKLKEYVLFDDAKFFRPIAAGEVERFKDWWAPLSLEQKMQALEKKLYFQEL